MEIAGAARSRMTPREEIDGFRLVPSHAVLRLHSTVDDPVQIIRAAQIQLRRWRRELAEVGAVVGQGRVGKLVGEIIAARNSLLRRSVDMHPPDMHPPQTGVESVNGGEGSARARHRGKTRRRIAGGISGTAGVVGALESECGRQGP